MRVLQALPEKQQAADTTISVLKRMDTFETHMEIQDVIKRHLFERIIIRKQSFHVAVNVFGCNRFLFANFVGKVFVIADSEPIFAAIGGVSLEDSVQLLDMRFGNLIRCMVDDIINTAEVVHRFHDIIDGSVFGRDSKRVGLVDVPRLFLGQFAAFYMVGVVC